NGTFVAKLNNSLASPTVLWSDSLLNFNGVDSLAVDASTGNVSVTGRTTGPSFVFLQSEYSMTNADTVVLTWDTSGSRLRSRGYLGTPGNLQCRYDSRGALVVSGNFRSQMDVGGQTVMASSGLGSFLAKYDSTDHLVFAKAFDFSQTFVRL